MMSEKSKKKKVLWVDYKNLVVGSDNVPWAATKDLTYEDVIEIMKEGVGFVSPPSPLSDFLTDDFFLKRKIYGLDYIILSSCPKCKNSSIVGENLDKYILFKCERCGSSFRLVDEE